MPEKESGERPSKAKRPVLEMLEESVSMVETYRRMFGDLQELTSEILDEVAEVAENEEKMNEVTRAKFAIAKSLTQILQRTINELTEGQNGLRK